MFMWYVEFLSTFVLCKCERLWGWMDVCYSITEKNLLHVWDPCLILKNNDSPTLGIIPVSCVHLKTHKLPDFAM